MTLLLLALASALGAVTRYLVGGLVQARGGGRFPWGTWVVNVSGCLLLGVLTGAGVRHGLDPGLLLVVGVGFLGSYTTFSTFSYETIQLASADELTGAVLNVVGSLVAGVAAAAAGYALALAG